MPEPKQKPGRSRQDYGTPWALINALEHRLGIEEFDHDFAADSDNSKAAGFWGIEADALTQSRWEGMLSPYGWGFLNPPFSDIAPWASKCVETKHAGGQIAFLVPAAVGSNWYRDYVDGHALVLALNGRLTFEGCTAPFPKDCIVALYSMKIAPGFEVWNWRQAANERRTA